MYKLILLRALVMTSLVLRRVRNCPAIITTKIFKNTLDELRKTLETVYDFKAQ